MNYLIELKEVYDYITGVAWYWDKIVYNNIIDINDMTRESHQLILVQ